jgi:5-methylcytosine-specific restriction endonuclease McrA
VAETREQHNARKLREKKARLADPVKRAEYEQKYAKYNADNAEKQRNYARRSRLEDPNKQKMASKRYCDKNPQRVKESQRRTWEKHSHKYLPTNKAWKAAHPEAVRDHNRRGGNKYRALKAGQLDAGIDTKDWQDQLEVFNNQCAYCLEPSVSVDHIDPISMGGPDKIENAVPCCKRCNSSKWKKSLLNWLLTSRIAQEGFAHPNV